MRFSKRNFLLGLAGALIAGIAAWLLLTRRQPPPQIVDNPRPAARVMMRDVTFFSDSLRRDMQYRVFLPAGAGNQKLPVVYLLHGGGGGGFRDWSNYSDVAQFASRGFLLVMPEGDYSYYTNAALRPQDRYENYIVNDLPADVTRRFPARDDRDSRAIAGVSMGGFGAVKLALQHPDRFVFAGALSPAIDVPRRNFTWRRLDQSRRFREIFGSDDSDSRRSNDPFFLVRSVDAAKTPYLYLTCGQREALLSPNREFAALLEHYEIAHEFHAVRGGHDWNQWNGQLPGLFDSLTRHLGVNSVSRK